MPNPPRMDWRSQGLQQGVCQKCGGAVERFRADIALTCPACKVAAQQQRSRQWYLDNQEKRAQFRKENAEQVNTWHREYYSANKDKIAERSKNYNAQPDVQLRRKNRDIERGDELRKYKAEWHKKNPKTEEQVKLNKQYLNSIGWHRTYSRKRRETDIQFKLKTAIRNRLVCAIKNNQKKGSAVKLLGCTVESLKSYLEAQFQEGMTWNNWGLRGWHIDHRIAISKFDLQDTEQLARACHYTNLQPLWAVDNLRKGAA